MLDIMSFSFLKWISFSLKKVQRNASLHFLEKKKQKKKNVKERKDRKGPRIYFVFSYLFNSSHS